eukprot:6474776-Amphidinium_carterae.2
MANGAVALTESDDWPDLNAKTDSLLRLKHGREQQALKFLCCWESVQRGKIAKLFGRAPGMHSIQASVSACSGRLRTRARPIHRLLGLAEAKSTHQCNPSVSGHHHTDCEQKLQACAVTLSLARHVMLKKFDAPQPWL